MILTGSTSGSSASDPIVTSLSHFLSALLKFISKFVNHSVLKMAVLSAQTCFMAPDVILGNGAAPFWDGSGTETLIIKVCAIGSFRPSQLYTGI